MLGLSFALPSAAQKTMPVDPTNVTAAELLSPEGKELIGTTITMWYQPVQVKTGDGAIWVGPNQNEMVLVAMPLPVHVLDGESHPVRLEQGDKIEVRGVVTQAPGEQELKKGWGVNGDDMFLIERSGVIVVARSVKLIRDGDEE
jgi:hypothetical protein